MMNRHDTPETSGFPKIGKPAVRALRSAGYTKLEQLNGVSEKELLQLHGFGPKAARIVREALEARGLSLSE